LARDNRPRDEITVVLGDEYDESLRDTVRNVVSQLNGKTLDKNWTVGGSQEIEYWDVVIEGQKVHIEAETYVGLSLTGPELLVHKMEALIHALGQ
jgi:predicted SpoU family rRNA methylase